MRNAIILFCVVSILASYDASGDELPPHILSGRAALFVPARFDKSTWGHYAGPFGGNRERGSETTKSHWNQFRNNHFPVWEITDDFRRSNTSDPPVTLESFIAMLTKGRTIDYLYWHGHTSEDKFIDVEAYEWNAVNRNIFNGQWQKYTSTEGIIINGRKFMFEEGIDLDYAWSRLKCTRSVIDPSQCSQIKIEWILRGENPPSVISHLEHPRDTNWVVHIFLNTEWIAGNSPALDLAQIVFLAGCEGGAADVLAGLGGDKFKAAVGFEGEMYTEQTERVAARLITMMLGSCSNIGNIITDPCTEAGNYSVSEAVTTPGILSVAKSNERYQGYRFYTAPRVTRARIGSKAESSDEMHWVYEYLYSNDYPGYQRVEDYEYPDDSLLESSRGESSSPGDLLDINLGFTRPMDYSPLREGILLRTKEESGAVRDLLVQGEFSSWNSFSDQWHGQVRLPKDWPDGETTLVLTFVDTYTEDVDKCLDVNGDGRGFDDENNDELGEPCSDTNHKFEVVGTSIIESIFNLLSPKNKKGISGPVSQGNPAALGDSVSTYFQFNREMDPNTIPEVWVISGIGMSYPLPLEDTLWVDGEDEDGKPLASSRFEATWNIPEDFSISGQEFLRLDLEVRGAKTASGREVKPQRKTKDDELLSLWADLTRPRPTVAGWIGPNVECGSLEIDFGIQDEPSYYEPGAPIEPPAAKFERMELHLEKDGAEILTAPLSDPNEHFVKGPPWAKGDYRWWVEVEDSAGNLDQISFEQQGQERTAAQHFGVSSCEENSTFCNRLTCNAEERSCDQDFTVCTSSDPCTSCHCDDIEEVCKCVNDCPPDPDPNGGPDENLILADDLPRWEDVENEDPSARVGVLMASNYPSMFGLLDEFGEKARLVIAPLSPEGLAGVDLLIVPSGGLRNQQTEEFTQGVVAYVESGGHLLVMDQSLGELYGVLPGEIEGYGWQQDRSCVQRNIWFEEQDDLHPALSSFGSNLIDIPIDGHFTVYPAGSDTLLRKVSNNRAALFSYPVGAGSITVTSSYVDYFRALNYGRSASAAVETWAYPWHKSGGVRFFRDMISWLKEPAELPRLTRDGGPIELSLEVTNDAPGGERAALAKLLVQEPNRQEIGRVVEAPLDLAAGETGQVNLTESFDGAVHDGRYGIWHVAVELYDAGGNLIRQARDNVGGRFVVPYPHWGTSYAPEDIVATITSDKALYLTGETAHVEFTVENQGDRERRLEIDIGYRHGMRIVQEEMVLAPGERRVWNRDYVRADEYTIHYGFYCQAFDLDDDMKLLADAGLRIWFVDYPLVLSMSTDKDRVAPGQPLAVTVTYLNLSESAINGRLVLRAEGLPVSEPELDLGPNEAGSVQTTLSIPADAGLGQVTLMGRYEDADGNVLGGCSHEVSVYSPILEVRSSLATDGDIYRRGDTILATITLANDSDETLDINYQLRMEGIESSLPASVTLAAGQETTIQASLDVPLDYPYWSSDDLTLAYWKTPGYEVYARKTVTIEVPLVLVNITAVSATPASVDFSGDILLEGLSGLEVDAGCRLYAPAGVMVAEDLKPAVILEPWQHVPLACHLPPGSLERGEYTVEVFAESPLARYKERIEKIESELDVKPPVTNVIGPSLAWEKSFGEAVGPIMLINKGDFSYPSVLVAESLPEAGLSWSREVAIGPRQEIIVAAPDGITIPYFRNATSHYTCIGREIMTETEDDLAAQVAGGFTVSSVETVRIETPRLRTEIENVGLNLCASRMLSFDVSGKGTVYGLGGTEEMTVNVSVPGAGFEQDVTRTISPGAPSWSKHFDVELPAGIENESREIRAEIVTPDVGSYPSFIGELHMDMEHFMIAPALLSASLSMAPVAAGDPGRTVTTAGSKNTPCQNQMDWYHNPNTA